MPRQLSRSQLSLASRRRRGQSQQGAIREGVAGRLERRMSVRFVFAIVSLVLALVTIGLGVAQRTVFARPDNVTAAISIDTSAPITIIDGETLNANPRQQTLSIEGTDVVYAAYGRTIDVEGWAGEASVNRLSIDPKTNQLVNEFTPGEPSVPSAEGSDLWTLDYVSEKSLETTVNVPKDYSFLVMSDGKNPAPSDISIVWPVDNSTPLAVPLIFAGTGLLLVGLALLFWAIMHLRNSRGPKRKPQKMPKLPRQPRYKPTKKPKAITARPTGRRSARSALASTIPLALVSSLILGGCSVLGGGGATSQPAEEVVSELEPTATSTAPAVTTEAPAVTQKQAERIVARAAEVIEEADKTRDAELAKTRLAGPALELRLANYKMRKADKKIDPLSPIPAGPVELTLPQQRDSWPRTVLAAIKSDDPTVPVVTLVLIQDNPRAQYLIHYAVTLQPGAVIPRVAEADVGTTRIDSDLRILALPPGELAAAYADILMKDTESEFNDLFVSEGDGLRVDVGLKEKKKRQKETPSTAKLIFATEPFAEEPVALATADFGALVAVSFNEIETIKVVETGAAVNAPPAVKAFLGKSVSTKGLTAVYNDQLLFYVPPVGSEEKIVLLGYSQGIISAKELKK